MKRLADSLSSVNRAKEEKVRKFKSEHESRSKNNNLLITDIRPDGKPVYRSILNANAAITTGVSKLQSGAIGLMLEGQNITLGVWDDGKIQNHIELGNRVIANEGDNFSDHATHVTGTLIASGINPEAKGMAPKAKVTAQYYDNDDAEMAALARPDQSSLLFSNHSYGQVTGWYRANGAWEWAGDPSISQDEDFHFGFYGQRAQAVDQIAFLAPYYSILWAAGNDRAEAGNGTHPPDCNNGTGYDCIIPDAVAKNIITVGAVDKVLNYTNPGSVPVSNFSSWGPTDDGRIKPDLVGDGVNLFSLSANGINGYTTFSGTSMATPNVAGSLALLQELYSKLHAGKFMKAATLKALAIHTAKEAGNFPGPDYSFGWGLVDVAAGADLLLRADDINVSIKELTITNSQSLDFILSPQANQKITATIVWTDPAGKPVDNKLDPANLMLVNDLDIKLTDESGNEYRPWILDPGNPLKGAIKGNNIRDNVEKIEFDLPVAKPYHLIVSHKGQLAGGKQDFSLVISYQSITNVTKTYYWIGDSGDWNDGAHWSYHSGDTAVNKIPSDNDNVIVDENSFDGVGINQIIFSQDQSIGSLLWINSNQSGIALNENNFKVNKSLSIASSVFQSYGPGTIVLSASSEGKLNLIGNEINSINLMITKGSWTWTGDATLGDLIIEGGDLRIEDAAISVKNLISNSVNAKALTMINSVIKLSEGSSMSKANLELDVSGSVLETNGAEINLNWNDIDWNGKLNVVNGKLIMHGNNTIDSLVLNAGSELMIEEGAEQTIKELEIMSSGLSPVKIMSGQNASLNFSTHKKYCFDFLLVENVEAKGIGVVNAGEKGVLSNAKGWSAQNCEKVLFPDFELNYPCEKGLTFFKDKSTGSPKQWKWTFPGPVHSTGVETSFSFSEAGRYPVMLEVVDDNTTRTYTVEIEIKTNTQSSNQIVANSDEMYSFNQASSYQWFRNEEMLPVENKRLYSYNGEDGTFFVVTYDQVCNRISEPLTITALEAADELVAKVYPNPSDQEIIIESKTDEMKFISMVDLIGRNVVSVKSTQRKITIPAGHFNDGIYLIETTIAGRKYRDKILIRH